MLVEHPRTAHRRRGAVAPEHTAPDLRAAASIAIRSRAVVTDVKLFADGADLEHILRLAADQRIRGLHDQPDADVEGRADGLRGVRRRLLEEITDQPISFEVFADDAAEIRRQARLIAAWGENVYVKVPVTTTERRVAGRRSCASSAPTASRST